MYSASKYLGVQQSSIIFLAVHPYGEILLNTVGLIILKLSKNLQSIPKNMEGGQDVEELFSFFFPIIIRIRIHVTNIWRLKMCMCRSG